MFILYFNVSLSQRALGTVQSSQRPSNEIVSELERLSGLQRPSQALIPQHLEALVSQQLYTQPEPAPRPFTTAALDSDHVTISSR